MAPKRCYPSTACEQECGRKVCDPVLDGGCGPDGGGGCVPVAADYGEESAQESVQEEYGKACDQEEFFQEVLSIDGFGEECVPEGSLEEYGPEEIISIGGFGKEIVPEGGPEECGPEEVISIGGFGEENVPVEFEKEDCAHVDKPEGCVQEESPKTASPEWTEADFDDESLLRMARHRYYWRFGDYSGFGSDIDGAIGMMEALLGCPGTPGEEVHGS